MGAITDLLELDIAAWIVGAFLIMAGANKGIEIIGKFSKSIGKPFKWVKKQDSDHELIKTTVAELERLREQHDKDSKATHKEISALVSEMKQEMKQFRDNRTSDRQQSFKIQKELVDAQKEISTKFDTFKTEINQRFSDSDERQNKRVQSDIKKDIAQIYRRCNASKTISKMELEVLEDLIVTYEEHGGENSFVHSVVQKEMYMWKVV